MIRGLLTLLTLSSVVFFPWQGTVILAIAASFVEPLVPLVAGIFADTLYYTPQAQTYALPIFSLYGAACAAIAFVVRSQVMTSIMKK